MTHHPAKIAGAKAWEIWGMQEHEVLEHDGNLLWLSSMGLFCAGEAVVGGMLIGINMTGVQ